MDKSESDSQPQAVLELIEQSLLRIELHSSDFPKMASSLRSRWSNEMIEAIQPVVGKTDRAINQPRRWGRLTLPTIIEEGQDVQDLATKESCANNTNALVMIRPSGTVDSVFQTSHRTVDGQEM